MTKLKIRDIKAILTSPAGPNLVVVKVETNEPELYGLGCATFTQRALAVKTAIEKYLRPFLVGKNPQQIEDIWQTSMVNSYWRNGPVLNNAISGVDMALWDIKGKLANLPLYQLFGGKSREGVAVYRHAKGCDEVEVEDEVRKYMEQGYRYVRCQIGGYGGIAEKLPSPLNAPTGSYFDPVSYAHQVPELFAHLRKNIGYDVELLHDVHERIAPIHAVRLSKELEPYRLFFLEDPVAPEDIDWLPKIREQSATPIAMGELFNNPNEWKSIIVNKMIDYIRVHISQIGGITPALKLIALCDNFNVKTAWHGPGDVSPVGHAANIHLDISSHNFGIQEWCGLDDRLREVFPGCPQVKDGYVYPNEKPGLGIDIDEKKAAEYFCDHRPPEWTETRTVDGSAVRP